jgi:peptide/nickel transport system substrate-binding protein
MVWDGLVHRDPDTGEYKPLLAKSWSWVDPLTLEFDLRDDVKFHDGQPFTGADVKATVEKVMASKGPISPILDGVSEVEVIDDHTVKFKTARPLGALPNNIALLGIAPASLVNNADYESHPVGTGPFKFESFNPGSQLVLAANEDYWGNPPGVAKLIFVDIPETTTRITALESGEIDLTWTFPATSYEKLSKNDSISVATVASFISYEMLFNNERPPLDDPRVREALTMAVDNDKIFGSLFGPLSAPSIGPLPPTVFGAAETGGWPYDPEAAVAKLKEAGINPSDLKLTLLGRAQQGENDVGLAMISDWAKIGVQVQPEYLELSTWAKKYVAKDFDLSLVTRPSNTGDADWTLGRLYLSDSHRIPCASKELDEYILAGQAAADPEVRKAAFA